MNQPLVQLGKIAHVGIVVKDAEQAARYYERVFGIGPWDINVFDMSGDAKYFLVDGKPAAPVFKAAFGWSGDVAIEFVEVISGETAHTRFLQQHGEGMQHLCFYVDDPDEVMAKLKTEGFEAVLDYEIDTMKDGAAVNVREIYLNSNEMIGGTTIQLLKITTR
jgi:catechol 2,3-dioxygenase-like lactoylglutathione lyase family enzyme